jgi:hypothetical protein
MKPRNWRRRRKKCRGTHGLPRGWFDCLMQIITFSSRKRRTCYAKCALSEWLHVAKHRCRLRHALPLALARRDGDQTLVADVKFAVAPTDALREEAGEPDDEGKRIAHRQHPQSPPHERILHAARAGG